MTYQHPYQPGVPLMRCGDCGRPLLLDRTCPAPECPSNTPTEVAPVTSIDEAVRRLRGRVGASVRGGNSFELRRMAERLRCPSCGRKQALRLRDATCRFCGETAD